MVSVIMNCYNSSEFLLDAINSVYMQTFKDWEIIFWDNASTDNSPGIARSFDNRLKYFRGEKNVSLGQARNLALEKAKGEYIAFLDCDDLWLPEKLESQIPLLEKNPHAGLLYSNYYILNEGRKLLALKSKQPQGNIFGRQLCDFSVGILTVVIRKKNLDSLGELFDPNLGLAEEFDLFLRLLYKFKAIYQEEAVAVYRVHPGMSSIRLMDKWGDEMVYVIEKLKRVYPELEKDFSKELEQRMMDLKYLSAKISMKQGDFLSTRKQINTVKFSGFKYFILYICSYMPVGLWNFISRYFIRSPL